MEQAAMDRVASLFAQHGDAVHAYAQARAGAALAPDIVSDTFVVACRRRDVLPEPALPWLLATARRVASTHLRTQKRQASLLQRMQSLVEREPQLAPEHGLGTTYSKPSIISRSAIGRSCCSSPGSISAMPRPRRCRAAAQAPTP